MKNDDAKGQIVFVGARAHGPVLVVWAPIGDEFDVREQAQALADEHMLVLGSQWGVTADDVAKFRASQKKSHLHGYWFSRGSSHAIVRSSS